MTSEINVNDLHYKRQIKCMSYKTSEDRYLHREVNVGPSQRRMEICSESLKEEN